MKRKKKRDVDQEAYRRLKKKIKQTYPPGRFVAIHGGKIVADAKDFDELDRLLEKMGIDPPQALIVEAGVDYPEYITILFRE